MKIRGRNSPQRVQQQTQPIKILALHPYGDTSERKVHNGSIAKNRLAFPRLQITIVITIGLLIFQSIRNTTGYLAKFVSDDSQDFNPNPYALAPGELPGYTGWARPEQTLAGYFQIESSTHSSSIEKYYSIIKSGDKYSLKLTCVDDEHTSYVCPSSGTLFYVRAYGPSVITGNVVDHSNSSYSIELLPIEAGEYTVEVVVTFSAPLELHDFPLSRNRSSTDEDEEEPGYEGYLVSNFPLQILVQSPDATTTTKTTAEYKQWCNLSQLTENSADSSLASGYWHVIDHVGRTVHTQLTPDDALVSLDGYRMGLNSLGVRMQYDFEKCELMHIRDIIGDPREGTSHVMGRCLRDLGFLHDESIFSDLSRNVSGTQNGIDVIFIGDSVMKLEMGFFVKLLGGSAAVDGSRGVSITFIETYGGIQATMQSIIATLTSLLVREQTTHTLPNKRVILFNSGLHDIDILCSSKRQHSRNNSTAESKSCADSYRETMQKLVLFIDNYPADVKVFRTTTAGWAKVRNVDSYTMITIINSSPYLVSFHILLIL